MSRLALLLMVGAVLGVGACADSIDGPELRPEGLEQRVNKPDNHVPPVPGDTVRISDTSEPDR